ncbi:MAG TPA: GGDEF domain-containing protein, partial [Mycobacterium sp.]
MRLGKARSLDPYYPLTAMLAARGAQTLTSRMIAALLFGLGLLAGLALFTGTGSQQTTGQVVWTAVSALALITGVNWLRRRWPTRTESVILVCGATVAILVGCVISKDPVQGVLGATTLTVVVGYTALFHTLRMVALVMTVGLA